MLLHCYAASPGHNRHFPGMRSLCRVEILGTFDNLAPFRNSLLKGSFDHLDQSLLEFEVHRQFVRPSNAIPVHAGPTSPPRLSLPETEVPLQFAQQSTVALVLTGPASPPRLSHSASPRRLSHPAIEVHLQFSRQSFVALVHTEPWRENSSTRSWALR